MMLNIEGIVFDKIYKSINDKRNYEMITLNNGLKVIIINDMDAIMSSATLSVNIGSLQNKYVPKDGKFVEIHGIAHFLEHMLFMGSEKYPEEVFYSNLLSKYSGTNNAYTDINRTCYYFSSTSSGFEKILDVFGNFFIKPLFNKNAIMREIMSIQEEHNKNYNNDQWRELQISRNIAKHDNIWNGFATGTYNSLNIDNIDELLDNFFKAYYVPCNMNLVIYSNKLIKDLIKIVENIFSLIPARTLLQIPKKNDFPYNNNKLVLINPIHNKNSLIITWQIPNYDIYIIKYRYFNPIYLISYLFKQKYHGSIFNYLKKKDYATNLDLEPLQRINNIFLFSIRIELTNNGFQHKERIINMIYKYIALLKRSDIKHIYNEIRFIKQQNFIYQSINDIQEYTKYISETLMIYQMNLAIEEILIVGNLLVEYDPKINNIISDIMEYFNEGNSVVYLISKMYQNLLINRDPWYGIEYYVYDAIPQDLLIWTENTGDTEKVYLPKENKYINWNTKIITNINSDKYPIYIDSFKYYKLWYQYISKFNNPYVNCIIQITLPQLRKSIMTFLTFKVYLDCIIDIISIDLQEATFANYDVNLSLTQHDLTISIYGPSELFGKLLSFLIKKILNGEVDKETFLRIRNKIYENLVNSIYIIPYENIIQRLFLDTGLLIYETKDMLHDIMNVDYDTTLNILHLVFNEVSIKCIITGNILLQDALILAKICIPLAIQNKETIYSINKLRIGEKKIIKIISDNPKEFNKAVGLFYNLGKIYPTTQNDWNYIICIAHLIDSMIKHEYINQIRTNEQLGYITTSDLVVLKQENDSILTYGFIIQSTIKDCIYLTERIERFIKSARNLIITMQNKDLIERKESLINVLLQIPKNLHALTVKSLNKAFNTDNIMNLEEILINTYNNITLNNILEFYDKYFYNESTRSYWIIQVD